MSPEPGERMPDLELPDHTGRPRTLSEVVNDDPLVLCFSGGWWWPKDQCFLRGLVAIQDEFEVAYTRIVVVSVDPPEVQSAFRAALGARFVFLSDAGRTWIERLGLREATDTTHDPSRPTVFTLLPDLTIHTAWAGYWYWGRPTLEELRADMRTISRRVRPDWTGTETAG